MAFYQFYLGVVPKEGLLKIHNRIPDEILVSSETGYFETEQDRYWKVVDIDVTEITQELDKIVKRADWGNDEYSYNWKTYSDKLDNDVSMYLNKESNKIDEFSFRVDLREDNLLFLKNMIELGEKYGWFFMDRKGVLVKPEFSDICKRITLSNNFKFLENPLKYFEDLDSGKIK